MFAMDWGEKGGCLREQKPLEQNKTKIYLLEWAAAEDDGLSARNRQW
jgi:hypothetical protein